MMEESPSKEQRQRERDTLRSLNTRFESLLENVRTSNFQIHKNGVDLVATKEKEEKILGLLLEKLEEARTDLRDIATFCNFTKHGSPTADHAVEERLRNEFEHDLEGKRGDLRGWAVKVADVKVDLEKAKAQHDVLKTSHGLAENISTNFNRKIEDARTALDDLKADEEELQRQVADAERANEAYKDKIAEFEDEGVVHDFSKKVVAHLRDKEANLQAVVHDAIILDRKLKEAELARNMDLLASELEGAAVDVLQNRKNNMNDEILHLEPKRKELAAALADLVKSGQAREDDLSRKSKDRDVITMEIEQLKHQYDRLRSEANELKKIVDDLGAQSRVLDGQVKGARDLSNYRDMQDRLKAMKETKAHMQKLLTTGAVDIEKEIEEYREILRKAEARFNTKPKNQPKPAPKPAPVDAAPFHFNPPPGFDNPSSSAPDSVSKDTRKIYKKGTATASRSKKSAPASSATTSSSSLPSTPSKQASHAPSVDFTPTPKKRRREDLPVVRITSIDPIHQRVELENTTDEAIDISHWKLVNVVYAFIHAINDGTVIEPNGKFTFMPRPSSKKRATAGRPAKKTDNSKKAPPPHTAYWETGQRDVEWPLKNARAILKDAKGEVVHDFSIGGK